MERPLRLIAASPVDALARTLEALLVVASQPLGVAELAEAAADDPERVETALGLLGERYREGRSGIVLEQVAGGWAFRASREAAEACGRLFERPVERNLSPAALETLAIVAYLGPCSRPNSNEPGTCPRSGACALRPVGSGSRKCRPSSGTRAPCCAGCGRIRDGS